MCMCEYMCLNLYILLCSWTEIECNNVHNILNCYIQLKQNSNYKEVGGMYIVFICMHVRHNVHSYYFDAVWLCTVVLSKTYFVALPDVRSFMYKS